MKRQYHFADLTGQRFGRLTVLERLHNKKGRVAYLCKCDCGKEVEVLAQSLKAKATTSCGCYHHELVTKDIVGQRVGCWAVIEKSTKRSPKGYIYWLCRCTCGVEKLVNAETLLNGKSSACGKCSKEPLKRRFCLHGHDTAIWGRSSSGSCRACVRDRHLRTHYGITIADFEAIYEAQGGKCAICDKPLGEYRPGKPGWGRGCRIEVDHDHKKGKRVSVRGLLCGGRWAGCNRKLGRIDNVKWLERVVVYLRHPPAQEVIGVECEEE